MMVFWIFVFPSTLRASPTNAYGQLLQQTMSLSAFRPSLLTKYKMHADVQYLHILPAGLWSICIPLQLTPALRASFPVLHKLVGWLVVASSILIFLSVFLIHHRKVAYIDNDFAAEHAAFISHASSSPSLHNTTLSLLLRLVPAFTALSALWFMLSLAQAIRCIMHRDVNSHKMWMMRHVGSGLGVAAQRCYFLLSAAAAGSGGMTATAQMLRFTEGIYVGFALSVAAAEVAVRCVQQKARGGEKDA